MVRKKPLYRFQRIESKAYAVMDGDGTVYRPIVKLLGFGLVKKSGENYKNPDGSFNLDGLLGRPLVTIKPH